MGLKRDAEERLCIAVLMTAIAIWIGATLIILHGHPDAAPTATDHESAVVQK